MDNEHSGKWAYLTVVGAALIHLSLGYDNTIGNMNPYLISYMNISAGQTVWFSAITISASSVAMPLGGFLTDKIGFRAVVVIGSIICSGGVALSSLTVSKGIGLFLFTYCIMYGIGSGLPFSVLFSLASDWFPKNRGVITGLILGSCGMGAVVFTPVQTALINPQNKPNNDTDVTSRVPGSFYILGALMFGMQLIGFILLRENSSTSETGMEDETSSSISCIKDKVSFELEFQNSKLAKLFDFTVTEALRSIDFYLIAFLIFINAVPVTLLSSCYKVFGSIKGLEDRYTSIVATCTALFNSSGRVIWGLVCDKLSFKLPLCWLLLQWALLFGTFPSVAYSPLKTFKPLFAVWVFLLFFTMAGQFILMPASASRVFGSKNTAFTFGLMYFFSCPSVLILATVVSFYDMNDDFDLVFYICCGLCLLGFVLALFLRDDDGMLRNVTFSCSNACNSCRVEPASKAKDDEEGSSSGESSSYYEFFFQSY